VGVRSKLEGFVEKLYPLRYNEKTNDMVYGKPEKKKLLRRITRNVGVERESLCE